MWVSIKCVHKLPKKQHILKCDRYWRVSFELLPENKCQKEKLSMWITFCEIRFKNNTSV